MEKTDIIETSELEVVAFAPEEIMVTDELPLGDLVIVEEPSLTPKEAPDYEKTQDLGGFMEWITKKMNTLPPHSGKTTAGCERVIAHLKMLDKEISKAVSRDVDCKLDDQAVEKFRKDIRKMIKKLDKRHKEINEAYDADDDKFASNDETVKTAEGVILPGELSKIDMGAGEKVNKADDKWVCPQCGKTVVPGDEEHIMRHKAMEHGASNLENKADDAPLYCKLCGGKFPNRRAAKAHADVTHPGESVTFSDMPPAPKTASDCACHVEKAAKVIDTCPKCEIKLWAASDNLMECISCDAVYERELTKEAGTARLTLIMTPFERAITGTIVNQYVSQGKNPEEIYAELKKKYSFTDRDELSIQQILVDMGYPMLKDRGHIGDTSEQLNKGKGIEFSTQYTA